MNAVANDYSQTFKSIPTVSQGMNLNMYLLALEAWKRHLTVEFRTAYSKNGEIKVRYSISSKNESYKFQLTLGDKTPKEARNIGKSKQMTKDYLLANNVSTPEGLYLDENQSFADIKEKLNDLSFPLVIKPAKGSLGAGVAVNVQDEETVKEQITLIRENPNTQGVIIEEQASGEDIRALIVNGKLIAAFRRRPANVVGNGKNSIAELIEHKNYLRQNNPQACHQLIEVNQQLLADLNKQHKDLNTVPEDKERVYLTKSTLISDTSEVVDCTEELSAYAVEQVEKAGQAIPGMAVCGVDLMYDDQSGTGFVLEVNSRPNIGGHVYPMEGKSRQAPQAILDFYFPEHRNNQYDPPVDVRFAFDPIHETLKSGIAKTIKLPKLPKEDVIYRQIEIQTVKFNRDWFQKQAVGRRVGGKCVSLTEDTNTLLIFGERERLDEFLKDIKRKYPETEVHSTEPDKFDGLFYPFPAIHEEDNENANQMESAPNELKKLRKENDNMKQSTSWKVTKPLRLVSGWFKDSK
ncbi:hypothetical protein [Halalkalibacillus halophilus]|uniref:hypothetical protein n=1 Tax=Halalkalibacillus halophilus TaxID=392827 RepID=UPI0004820307|nr:hypothetical protein [Halalkalibacillus halophilus]